MDGEIQSKRYMYMYENRIMKPVGSYFKKWGGKIMNSRVGEYNQNT
jgi:hypothetical protein